MKTVKSTRDLARLIQEDSEVRQAFQDNPEEAIKQYLQIPDTRVYRMIVTILGVLILTIVVSVCIPLIRGELDSKVIPEFLVATVSTALGALAGTLIPSSSN